MTRGIVTTPHHLATAVGAEILKDGGNAVDAAVAANAVLCVVYPHMTTIGGDLFCLLWAAGASAPVVVEGAGGAGSRVTLTELRERGLDAMPEHGPLTVTVPGVVHAWGRLVEIFGRLGLQPLMAPASALAQEGFVVTRDLAAALAAEAGWLMRQSDASALFPPLKAGMLMRNPDLASTLRDIGRNGFNGFYRGEIAHAIVDTLERQGGLLTTEDMAVHRSSLSEALGFGYRDVVLHQAPPPSQGVTLIGMLVRGGQELPSLDEGALAGRVKELRDAVYPLRDAHLADPRFVEVPLEPFLDPGLTSTSPARTGRGGTVQLCVADEDGNVVSLMQSVAYPFGSGVVAKGTGILLQNRGTYFSLDPRHPNCLAPRKRTMHTLMPGIVSSENRPIAALGSMGGDAQPQLQLQVLTRLLQGMTPEEAVAAPRVVAEGDVLLVEADHPAAVALSRSRGDVKLMPPKSSDFGHAQALVLADAGWSAGADPRSDGSVASVGVA